MQDSVIMLELEILEDVTSEDPDWKDLCDEVICTVKSGNFTNKTMIKDRIIAIPDDKVREYLKESLGFIF